MFVKTLNNRRRIFAEVEEEEKEKEKEKEREEEKGREEEVDEVIGDLILPNSRGTVLQHVRNKHDLEDHRPSETPLLNPPITTTSHDIHIDEGVL